MNTETRPVALCRILTELEGASLALKEHESGRAEELLAGATRRLESRPLDAGDRMIIAKVVRRLRQRIDGSASRKLAATVGNLESRFCPA